MRSIITTIAEIAGIGLVTVGIALVFIPAAFIFAGGALTFLGWWNSR